MTEQDFINDSFQGVEEKIIEAIRLLGVNAMGIDPEPTRREALDELAMALTQLETGWERVQEVLPCRTEKPAPPLKPAVSPSEPKNITSSDVKAGKAEKQPEAPRVPTAGDMARFRRKEALKRSLIGPGEILVEESFLQKALEAVESILEMAPHVRQSGDGGPSLEDESSRAFSALRAALRCGVRAIVEDIDASDNAKLEAAQ